jgi:hypothetical protein
MSRDASGTQSGCTEGCSEGYTEGYSGVHGGHSVGTQGVLRGLLGWWGARWGTPITGLHAWALGFGAFESDAFRFSSRCQPALNPRSIRAQSALNPHYIRAKSALHPLMEARVARGSCECFVSCGLDAVGRCRALSVARLSGASRADAAQPIVHCTPLSALARTRVRPAVCACMREYVCGVSVCAFEGVRVSLLLRGALGMLRLMGCTLGYSRGTPENACVRVCSHRPIVRSISWRKVRMRSDALADAPADTAVDARADAHACAHDRRAGRCAVGCVSTLEHPEVPLSTIEYPVYLTLCAPRIPLWAPPRVPCEYPKAEYPRECPREYPCEYPCECRSSPL